MKHLGAGENEIKKENIKKRLFEYYGNTEIAYKILEIRTRWLKYRRLI